MKASVTENLYNYDLQQHKIKLLDERKQAEFQWLENPSQTNGDNLNNVRRESTRTFRKKEGIAERKNLLA
jgi:hypothetical protein